MHAFCIVLALQEQLGDMYSKGFCRKGNHFVDLESLSSFTVMADITRGQHKISSMDRLIL